MPVAFRYKAFRFFFYSIQTKAIRANPCIFTSVAPRVRQNSGGHLTFIWRRVMALTHASCVSCKGS